MTRPDSLTNVRIRVVFAEEIAGLGGTIADTIHQDDRLYLRAVLPRYGEVGRMDTVQCGVALRSVAGTVQIHPYVFRLICENGAIMAHALQTCRIDNLAARAGEGVEKLLREAIAACGSKEAFELSAKEMRQARNMEADHAIQMMAIMARLPQATQERMALAQQFMERFRAEGDNSRFGLMNAITATARDTDDPELRWQLEEFGGGVPVAPNPKPVRTGTSALSHPTLAELQNLEEAADLAARETRQPEAVCA